MISRGYSLIELMVVVAIIGIIAGVAYPSYQGYMQDTYQGQAIADLKLCSLKLESYYSNSFTYAGADGTVCTLWSPSDGAYADRKYTLTLPTLTASNFVIRAAPVGEGQCVELNASGNQTNC